MKKILLNVKVRVCGRDLNLPSPSCFWDQPPISHLFWGQLPTCFGGQPPTSCWGPTFHLFGDQPPKFLEQTPMHLPPILRPINHFYDVLEHSTSTVLPLTPHFNAITFFILAICCWCFSRTRGRTEHDAAFPCMYVSVWAS